MRAVLLLAALVLWPETGGAQQTGRCLLQVLNVDRQGVGQQPVPGVQNWFAGGNVRMRCAGQEVRMWSDSVASYQGEVIQFIGTVRFQDSTVEMTADFGTYFRNGDRWEARGNVVLTNRKSGAVLRGPMLDYLPPIRGVRDTSAAFAELRPTVTVPVRDSLGQAEDPYVIVADRIRFRGEDRMYGGGRVMVDRTDFQARGDSLRLDTGSGSDGVLLGNASLRRTAADSFQLRAARIDLTLEQREVSYVLAQGGGGLETAELNLVADTIGVDLAARQVRHVVAWGDSLRPLARSADGYEVRGDSLAFDTPDQRLSEARVFGDGWVGASPDSGSGERDWVAGDTVTATFTSAQDSTGATRSLLDQLIARRQARAYYRQPPTPTSGGCASIGYTRADYIRLIMKHDAATATVDEVISIGNVDGAHLQPSAAGSCRATAERPPPTSGGLG